MTPKNTKTISIIPWALIATSLYTFVTDIKGAVQDFALYLMMQLLLISSLHSQP
jgi:ABC-type multidrug transport system permease subunit